MDIRGHQRNTGNETTQFNLMASLGLTAVYDRFEIDVQTSRIGQAAAIWRAAIYAQLFACALIFAFAWNLNAYEQLADAGTFAGIMLGLSLSLELCFKSQRFWRLPPHRQIQLSVAFAAAIGVTMTFLAWQLAELPNGYIAAILIAGLIAAGTVTLATLMSMHLTMLSFMTAVVAAAMFEIGSQIIFNIGMAMLACLWLIGMILARHDTMRSRKRYREELHGRRASRLLSEFEAQGNGWFWETDRVGNLTYLSNKLAKTLNRPAEEIIGSPFIRIIRAHGDSQEGERTLGYHISTRTPFTDLTVRAAIDDGEHWWSVSGRPNIDEIGQFRGFVGSGSDLTEKRRTQAEANRLARYDTLTELYNRAHMRDALAEALGENGRPPKAVALFLLDLDRFKTVNDTLGHPVGDALLRNAAQRLKRTVGDKGMVGRLGGDEFKVIVQGDARREDITQLATAIISSLSQPYMIEGATVTIGCSIGIALAPQDGTSSEQLVRSADLALYAAKGDGRGVHRSYEPHMHHGAKKRKRLEDDLRMALTNGELHMAYQPVVKTSTEQIVAYEALIRWTHPEHGPISPADFIPVAEDINLIDQIGEWVMRTACREASNWPNHVRVAVNVSPIQFSNSSLPSMVTSALSNAQLPPDRLELEITEGVFVNESADSDKMFKTLKSLGVRLALDDFGTGYSSLGYLKKAPFDKIKIDRSFICGAAVSGNRNAAIVKAIVTLANTLKMETTAEGVELLDEVDLVRELGCSHIQGYIYGRPMLAKDVLIQLEESGGKAKATGHKASRSARTKMLRRSKVEIDGRQVDVLIRDMSATGAMFEGLTECEINTDVLIELLEGQMFPARIRWSKEDRVGIEFARSFDLERLTVRPQKLPFKKVAQG